MALQNFKLFLWHYKFKLMKKSFDNSRVNFIGCFYVSNCRRLSGPRIDGIEGIVWCSDRRRVRIVFRFNLWLFLVTMVDAFMVT